MPVPGAFLSAAGGRPKLVVFFRGAFCSFCQDGLRVLQSKVNDLTAAGIDLVAVSADNEENTRRLIRECGLSFPIGFNLSETQMREVGLYISSPLGETAEMRNNFCEPGYFLLNPDSTIKYVAIGSMPMGAWPDVDNLLRGYAYSVNRAAVDRDFANVIWGSVP
eukprot:jgi/Mesvir1/23683/Mv18638-RA.1